MRSIWGSRLGFATLVMTAAAGSGTVTGCAQERAPIDRTQAGILDKTFFLGPDIEDFRDDPEFRTKSFNIDSPANADNFAGTIGGASAVDRIRWEVTEHTLLARRSYQESPGADNHGLPRVEVSPGKFEFPTKATGTIIAAYKIESHFDIRRDYNPQTGEELNVVVENSTDRPWNQRRYMRVDWSANIAESTNGNTSWIFGEGSIATSIQYAATNPADEDAPHFELDGGYFDITNKYQLAPAPLPGFGVPECVLIGFFNGSTSWDCTPPEVKVRSSYVKLTGKEDFEPFEESLAARDIVGNWNNGGNTFNREYGGPPITAWDPQYGYTDAKTKTFFSIHNIWMQSHQSVACSSNADANQDGTADECANNVTGYAGSKGSQCDVQTKKCTIPVRDREIKTIGYWLNAETPPEFTDQVAGDKVTITEPGPIEEMTITWNQFLKVAVATRREVECRRTKDGSRDDCHGQFFEPEGPESKDMVAFGGWGIDRTKALPIDKGKPVIATCHNPVRDYDPTSCGKAGEAIRLGDVRKNYHIYWPYSSRAPYGGLASIGGDPLTGEMVAATATTMGRSVTRAAAQQRDIIQLALGDANVEDFIQGGQTQKYADLIQSGRVNGVLAKGKTDAELKAAVAQIDQASVRAVGNVASLGLDGLSPRDRSLARAKLLAQQSPMTARIAADDQRVATLMNTLGKTPYASDVANRGLLQLVASSQDQSTSVFSAIKTFSQMDPSQAQDLLDRYQAYLGSRGVCFHDSASAAAAGSIYQPALAPYFRQKYGSLDPKARGQKIYDELVREAIKGIGFHEIGHSIGLRHNFASSWDALNYAPQYWQLRTNEGQATAACKNARDPASPDSCMGPRYLDPMTDDEQGLGSEPRPGIEYFGGTTTMEYQIERFGETAGGGTYDLHAMKTLYGRVLETFDDRIVPPQDQQNFAILTLSQGIPSTLVFDPKWGYGMHYTHAATQAKVFDPQRDCRAATPEEMASAKWRIVHGKVCAPVSKNHLAYEDMQSKDITFTIGAQVVPTGVSGVRWTGNDENGTPLVRWQFRYGEDYSRGGYIHAKPFDSGADIYETTVNVAKRFDLTYPWQYFRRLDKEFAWWAIPNAVDKGTFARIRGYHWSTATDISRASAADLRDDDRDRPAVMATLEMWNFLQRVITMPEPGSYGPGADTTRRTPTRPGALTIFDVVADSASSPASGVIGNVGLIDGRYVQIDFDNTRGGSWDYQHYPSHVGFDEEKALALRELVDSRPTLSTISRENALDGRDPYISFRTDLPHAVDRLVGGLLSEDWETVAPSMLPDKKTLATFSLAEMDPTKLVRPQGANVIFPNVGYANQLGTGTYALIFSRFSSDMALASKMRVSLEGDSGPAIPDAQRIAFTDPVTGKRYLASRFGTEMIQGRAVEKGIASRMIQRANELLVAAYRVKTETSTGNPVIDTYGAPELELGAGTPTSNGAAYEQRLRRYVGLLDAMRQLDLVYGAGPLGGGGGGGGGE